MSLRHVAWLAALLAGLVWLLRWVTGGEPVLHWVGLGLLGAACAVGGALLVGNVLALRIVVAIALPLLVLSLVELVRPGSDSATFDGILGIVLALAAAGALLGSLATGRDHAERSGDRPGGHAGRRRAG